MTKFPWTRLLAVVMASALLPCESISYGGTADQDANPTQAPEAAAIQKVRDACHVTDTETDPKKVDRQNKCMERAVQAFSRKLAAESALQTTVGRLYRSSLRPIPLTAVQGSMGGSLNIGGSATGTPSSCGLGSGDNNPLIRVHRLLMAPKDASDDFGYRLGRRYIIYQITISNDNKDYQYLIHDVSVDLSPLFNASPGTYKYSASSQDLTLLRGIPEKGQDLDRRNLILHVLQGIGSVAGAVSGLSAFSDVMGSSVAVFNGSFLQGYVGIAPDHTGTQLNRLSDSAYITNTLVDKQRARTIAIFIPEATLLSRADQTQYWRNPQAFLQQIRLNEADVCVDGAFITTVAPPSLTAAVLTPKAAGTTLGPGVLATLTVQGTNLSTSDTQVVGLGATVLLTTTSGTTGSVDITLPDNYAPGMPVHLASAANPSITSATIPTTEFAGSTLTSAVLTPKAAGTTLGPGVLATLTVKGTNLSTSDTQVVGLGAPVTLTTASANGTSGSVDVTLPPNYFAGMPVHLASAINPSVTSASIATTTQ